MNVIRSTFAMSPLGKVPGVFHIDMNSPDLYTGVKVDANLFDWSATEREKYVMHYEVQYKTNLKKNDYLLDIHIKDVCIYVSIYVFVSEHVDLFSLCHSELLFYANYVPYLISSHTMIRQQRHPYDQ